MKFDKNSLNYRNLIKFYSKVESSALNPIIKFEKNTSERKEVKRPVVSFDLSGGRQSRRRVGKFEVQSRSRCTRYRCLVVCWSRNNNSLMVAGTRRVTRSASISLLCCSFFVFGRLLHLAVLLFGLFFSTLWRRQKKRRGGGSVLLFTQRQLMGGPSTAGLLSHPKNTHTITTTRTDLPEVHHRPIN